MSTNLRWRLSLLMFLQYAPAGALVPLFSLRLQELGFTPVQIGWTCATQALASLVGPLLAGQLADRWFPAQRCLAVCALLSGILLWLLAGLTEPWAVFALALAFWLVMGPAITLGTALSFAHLSLPERDFGRVRLWGTVGWVVPCWALGYWFGNPAWARQCLAWMCPERPVSELADAIRLGSLCAFLLGGYALTLPHTPPQRQRSSWLAPLAALRLLRQRAFAIYFACALGICVTIPFSTQVTPLLLEHLGIERKWLSPTLTIAQSMEVTSLALLPMFLLRLGLRGTMLVGLAAPALALFILTAGQPTWLVIAATSLNGLCICCFVVAGQVFVNSRARGDIRVSAQSLLTFTYGVGLAAGNLLVGWIRREVRQDFPATFAVAAVIALALCFAFFLGFREEKEPAEAPMEGKPGLETDAVGELIASEQKG